MHLIIGLGNPGEKYLKSRHNAGFIALRAVVGDTWTSESHEKSLISHETFLDRELLYAMPQTFMNNSGLAVKTLQKKHGVSPENIIVIHDDIDLPFSTMKIQFGRGSGGHNGVQSIIDHIGTNEFIRIKIGIAPKDADGKAIKPRPGIFQSQKAAVSKYVLKDFSKSELDVMKEMKEKIHTTITTIVKDGRQVAMNKFN